MRRGIEAGRTQGVGWSVAGAAFLGLIAIAGISATARYSYPLFHTLVEVFSMVVAGSVFVVGWNSRDVLDTDYLLFIGVSFLFFALLDVAHTLAYPGVALFQGFGANLPAQILILQRTLLAVSFLIAPVFLTRRVPRGLTITAFAVVCAVGIASILWLRVFPDMFVPGRGLMPLKIWSEYAIIAMFLVSVARLVVHRRRFDRAVLFPLIAGLLSLAVSEGLFAVYISPFGPLNFAGHVAQMLAFYLVYVSVVRTALVRPYAALYRDLADSEDRYRRVAETLQTEILKEPQRVEGLETARIYKPASDVARIGGDFYDVLGLEDGMAGIVLGDVSGKGLEAAAATAQARSTVRALAHVDPRPSFVLAKTNEMMEEYFEEDQFVTVVYAAIDLQDGRTALATAGHPHPVVCSRRSCYLLSTPANPPLGAFGGIAFEEMSWFMRPGECLVLYSDGLTEARRGKDVFGEERLVETVSGLGGASPDRIVNALLGAASSFARGRLGDDVAILGVRLEGLSPR